MITENMYKNLVGIAYDEEDGGYYNIIGGTFAANDKEGLEKARQVLTMLGYTFDAEDDKKSAVYFKSDDICGYIAVPGQTTASLTEFTDNSDEEEPYGISIYW